MARPASCREDPAKPARPFGILTNYRNRASKKGSQRGNHERNKRRPMRGVQLSKPIGIYYEHPDWYRPLFQQLDARGVNWKKIHAGEHSYDVALCEPEYSLIFNRMSPSAWQRGLGHVIFYTLNYLQHLEAQGVRVVNGSRAFTHETSKALQLTLLESLGLPYPKALVINHPSQALAAAERIGYPLVVKPNIGGSGAGIIRFDRPEQLKSAVKENQLYFGIDQVALVQEFFPARDNVITRVEVLGGKFLYAIQIHTPAIRSIFARRIFARAQGERNWSAPRARSTLQKMASRWKATLLRARWFRMWNAS